MKQTFSRLLTPSFQRCLPLLGILVLAAPLGAQTKSTATAKAPAAKPKAEKPPIIFVPTDYELEDAFPGLLFDQPLGIVQAPGDKNRLFIVGKTGRIQVITGLNTSKPSKHLFLDLTRPPKATLETTGECGVLGLAFPPDHAKNGRFFVYYSLKIAGGLHQRVSRFNVFPDSPDKGDPTSEQPLITQADEASNHNGGDLHFGPDGYLYISVGDGGSGNDKLNHARFIDKGFHAAILRIDVDKQAGSLPPNPHPGISRAQNGTAFYAVPPDNPYVNLTWHHSQSLSPESIRTEIWATGLRNPWRFSFDPVTERLFTGDVGQGLYEEVNIITKGGDYGWSYREATHPFTQGPAGSEEPANFQPIAPIFEYPRTVGMSITGGIVSYGQRYPNLKGSYIFADYATGRVIALRESAEGVWKDALLAQEPGIAGIGHDPRDGETLFANLAFGTIKRLKLKASTAAGK
jgi:glucose/arabinose dehydrogenase